MTNNEIVETVKKICKENGMDFIFLTNEVASWSVNGDDSDKLVKVISALTEATDE